MEPVSLADLLTVANSSAVLRLLAPGYRNLTFPGFDKLLAFGDTKGIILLLPSGSADASARSEWEWHWLMVERRGAEALRLARQVLHEMFTRRGARVIKGYCPATYRAARRMNRALGARPVGATTLPDGREILTYQLERSEWVSLQRPRSAQPLEQPAA